VIAAATDLASLAAELDAQFSFRGNVLSKVDDVLQVEVLDRNGDSWGATVLALYHQDRAGRPPDRYSGWVPPVDVSVPVTEIGEHPDLGPVLRFLRGCALRRGMPLAVIIDPTTAWAATWDPVRRSHAWHFRIRGHGEQATLWANRATAAEMATVGLSDLDEDTLAMIAPLRALLSRRVGLVLERSLADEAARSAADAVRLARG
jgi:hypothetical protein